MAQIRYQLWNIWILDRPLLPADDRTKRGGRKKKIRPRSSKKEIFLDKSQILFIPLHRPTRKQSEKDAPKAYLIPKGQAGRSDGHNIQEAMDLEQDNESYLRRWRIVKRYIHEYLFGFNPTLQQERGRVAGMMAKASARVFAGSIFLISWSRTKQVAVVSDGDDGNADDDEPIDNGKAPPTTSKPKVPLKTPETEQKLPEPTAFGKILKCPNPGHVRFGVRFRFRTGSEPDPGNTMEECVALLATSMAACSTVSSSSPPDKETLVEFKVSRQ
ncbi:hypothetical protein B0H13DRAFT_1899733 [Mycena leptocephala]|nr:hypothetical protein B0H13DRAFT_1899733 [Mycena leptocephala]